MDKKQLLNYSMELSLLAQLLQCEEISENEYQKIKQGLMREYHILSDLTAMIS